MDVVLVDRKVGLSVSARRRVLIDPFKTLEQLMHMSIVLVVDLNRFKLVRRHIKTKTTLKNHLFKVVFLLYNGINRIIS